MKRDFPSGIIAENYVICELFRNEYECVQSPNPVNKGWDFIVIKDPQGKELEVKLQVKGVLWQENTSTSPTITGSFSKDSDFDYLVIVVINFRENDYLLYVIPKDDLLDKNEVKQKSGLLCSKTNKVLYKGNSISFSTFKDEKYKTVLDLNYLNKWQSIST